MLLSLSEVPLIRPSSGPSKSGLNSESVLKVRPYYIKKEAFGPKNVLIAGWSYFRLILIAELCCIIK